MQKAQLEGNSKVREITTREHSEGERLLNSHGNDENAWTKKQHSVRESKEGCRCKRKWNSQVLRDKEGSQGSRNR